LTYAQELLPKVLAYSYKFFSTFNGNLTLDYVGVTYPIWAFGISLIVFFALCLYLSKSRIFAIIASSMLAFSASYFQRTGAGIGSHEALGMVFLFLALLVYSISLNNFKKGWNWTVGLGISSGIALALSFVSWGGASNFALMIFGLAIFISYLFAVEKEERFKFLTFNLIWVALSVLMMPLFGYSFSSLISRIYSNYGIIIPFSIAFIVVDLFIEKFKHKLNFVKDNNRFLYSLLATLVIGLVGLTMLGKNPLNLVSGIYHQLLFPFGQGRVGLTVSYYAQPYLSDVIGTVSKGVFFISLLGMIFIGIEFGKNISSKKNKFYFNAAWTVAILGMLYSRYSPSSIFNGTNLISQLVYIASFLIFASCFYWMYINEKFKVDYREILLFSWMIIMLMSMRSAVRVVFIIVTFLFVSIAYSVNKSYEYGKEAKNRTKYIWYIVSIISLITAFIFIFGNPIANTNGNYQITKYAGANSGPLANDQWQNAMSWIRNNTAPDAVFAHWWDYGYQIQTMSNRTTILDGGNANIFWDYMMGRYVLTEKNPDATLSFMKTHNVSYLLIDPTDVGKYAAYSKIGSNDNWDRFSTIPVFVSDSRQQIEKANQTTFVYAGQTFVDEDIIYNGTFLPGPTYDEFANADIHSYLIGILIDIQKAGTSQQSIGQPIGVFYYNKQQIRLPLRYVSYQGKLIDFGRGINSTFFLFTQVTQSSNSQIQMDPIGAGIYLSSKTKDGLFAQLYLMGYPDNRYPTIKIANKQEDYVVNLLKQQGVNVGSFVYFNGLRAPLSIWEIDYPSDIVANEEFMAVDGGYGAFDNLTFRQ
jgi:hypothetical protein